MPTIDELQKQHEARLDALLAEVGGRGRDSDHALVRALVHRAVHLAADRKAAEFCGVATLLAEMTTHAHEVFHGKDQAAAPAAHGDVRHN